MPKRSRSPCTTSVGTPTASSSGRRLAGAAPSRRRGGRSGNARQSTAAAPVASAVRQRDPRARGASARDERQPLEHSRPQVGADGGPRRVELARRSLAAPSGHAVRLLDESDAQACGETGVRRGDEIRRGHSTPGAVTQDQPRAGSLRDLHVRTRRPVGRLQLEDLHAPDAAMPRPMSSSLRSGLTFDTTATAKGLDR